MGVYVHISQHFAQAEGAECVAAATAAAAVLEGREAEFGAQVQLRPVRQDGSFNPADNLVRGVAAVGASWAPCWGGL